MQDKETTKVLSEGERVSNFTKSDDYRLIKDKLIQSINSLDSISAFPVEGLSNEQVVSQLQARAGAISIVHQWIADIEGIANQAQMNSDAMKDKGENDIVKHL